LQLCTSAAPAALVKHSGSGKEKAHFHPMFIVIPCKEAAYLYKTPVSGHVSLAAGVLLAILSTNRYDVGRKEAQGPNRGLSPHILMSFHQFFV
jgi:hypothetical protein